MPDSYLRWNGDDKIVLTFIVIFGGDSKDGVLDVFIFVHFRFVKSFIEVRWIVILVRNTNTDKFCNWK